jgi:hypothetical protein
MNRQNFKTNNVNDYLPEKNVGENFYFKEDYTNTNITSKRDKTIHEKETKKQKDERVEKSKKYNHLDNNDIFISNPSILPKITGSGTHKNNDNRIVTILNRNIDNISVIKNDETTLNNNNFGVNSNILYTKQYREKIINSNSIRNSYNDIYSNQMRK